MPSGIDFFRIECMAHDRSVLSEKLQARQANAVEINRFDIYIIIQPVLQARTAQIELIEIVFVKCPLARPDVVDDHVDRYIFDTLLFEQIPHTLLEQFFHIHGHLPLCRPLRRICDTAVFLQRAHSRLSAEYHGIIAVTCIDTAIL